MTEINTTISREIIGSVAYTISKHSEATGGNVEIHAVWIIPNFINVIDKPTDNNIIDQVEIYSPPFTDTPPAEWKFRFMISRVSKVLEILCISQKLEFWKSVQIKSFIFDKLNFVFPKTEQTICLKHHQIADGTKWQYLKELSYHQTHLEDNDTGNLICMQKNGSLRLKFEFIVLIPIENETPFDIPPTQLTNDWERLYNNGTNSDLVMKSSDNEEFKVHKGVLACRSEVLKANFQYNTLETITNTLESPIQASVLHEILLYIYTDKAPNVDNISGELLAAADYYQLERLKTICEETLYNNLNIDNALETFELANLYSANTLKQLTLEFIKGDENLEMLLTNYQLNRILVDLNYAKFGAKDE